MLAFHCLLQGDQCVVAVRSLPHTHRAAGCKEWCEIIVNRLQVTWSVSLLSCFWSAQSWLLTSSSTPRTVVQKSKSWTKVLTEDG